MKLSGAGISNIFIIVCCVSEARIISLKKAVCCLACNRDLQHLCTCIGICRISTMHHVCMTIIISSTAGAELHNLLNIEIRCQCFRLGSLASG